VRGLGRTVRAWETGDADLVIWGTHNVELAIDAVLRFYIDDCGFTQEQMIEDEFVVDAELMTGARRLWGHPGLPNVEGSWAKGVSQTGDIKGYVPFMVISR
jgi:hypothetical protein